MTAALPLALAARLLLSSGAPTAADLRAPITCDACAEWNAPVEPFRIHGESWFVGVRGLSVLAVRTKEGVVLLDGALPQSVERIEASLKRLGLSLRDVKAVLASHAHFDHVGGIAAIQQASGAEVLSSARGAIALKAGEPTPDDPQFGFGPAVNRFPKVERVRVVVDGEQVTFGGVTFTAHDSAGHTPGGLSWSWPSCEGTRCISLVYADSLNAVGANGFRFSGDAATGTHAGACLAASIARIESLPCDAVVSVHPDFTETFEKAAKARTGSKRNPFLEADGCRRYAKAARERLQGRLDSER